MDASWMADLPLTRATVEWRGPLHAPPDLGVTVRGAFGAAMFDVACARPHRDCPACDLVRACPVPTWFDPGRLGSDTPRPYVLRVVHAPGAIRATWTWIGPIPRPTLLTEALLRAGAVGLGADRVPHVTRRLSVEGEGAPVVVVEDGVVVGAWPRPTPLGRLAKLPLRPTGAEVTLASRCVLPSPDFDGLVRAALSRVRGLARYVGVRVSKRWPEVPPRAAVADLHGETAGRWSQRQRARVDLSGFLGTLRVGPAVAEFADLLAAAELLGVGGGTSAGNGAIDVQWFEGGRG